MSNIVLDLARKILQSKLDQLSIMETVGDSHGVQIEYVSRIEDTPDGVWQYKVCIWDEMEGRRVETMGFSQLVSLVSTVCNINYETISGGDWPVVAETIVNQEIQK